MLIDRTILVIILSVILTEITAQPTFQQFLATYNKSYSNPVEYAYRKIIYDSNLKHIIDSLQPPLNQYSLKTTKFMDWTDEQLNRLKAKLPPIINVGPKQLSNATNIIVSGQFPKVGAAPLPTTLNWLTKDGVTPVKDQKDCGSCWAFSSVGLFQSHMLIQTGQVYNLSEQFTMQCNPYGTGCSGGDPARLLDFIAQVGLPRESDYPYDFNNGHFGICDTKNRVYLPDNSAPAMTQLSTDSDLMRYLQTGPIVTLFSIHDDSTFKIYSSGSYTGCLATTPFGDLNHAVIVIGYDETNWIIKNSWGTDWGVNGIAYISRNQNCGIGLFNLQLQTCPVGQYYVKPIVPNEYGYLLCKESIVCQSCSQQCIACTDPTTCTRCQANQYLQAGACVNSCASYLITSDTNCICTNGSYFENGECKQCSSYCQTCVNATFCTQCLPSYYLNALDTSCYSSCPAGTQPINNVDCTCTNGTYLQQQSCPVCLNNCQYCTNVFACVTCLPGYVVSYARDQCNACPVNCNTCLSPFECITCQSGYVQNVFDLLCYKTCPLPYMIVKQGICICLGNVDTTNFVCLVPCVLNCLSCIVQNICDTCINGTFLNTTTGNCTKCATGCTLCANSSTNCSTCLDGYYQANFVCQQCPDNCTMCQSIINCTACIPGLAVLTGRCTCSNSTYYYNGSCIAQCPNNMIIKDDKCVCNDPTSQYINGQCLGCNSLCTHCNSTANCLACTANAQLQNGTCTCLSGYFIDITRCTKCIQPCKQCLNASYCTQCQLGYKQYTSVCCVIGQYWNGSACLSCKAGCADCQTLDACSSCPATYQLSSGLCQCNSSTYNSNGSCVPCINPCYSCVNSTYCTVCANPFIQLNGQCTCPEFYVKSGQQCLLCSVGCTNCLLGGICSECQQGYFLSNSTKACFSCPINCKTCSNNITCTVCFSPYVLLFSRCLLINTGNITDVQTSNNQCPFNCYLCYSSTACYQCQPNYYITQTLICVTGDTKIWVVQQVDKVNSLIVGAAIGNSSCQLAQNGNQTINLPFTALSNIPIVNVGNNSVVYMGSSSFNFSGVTLIYGVPGILYSFVGTAPNRLATIIYRNTDCMSNQRNWWAMALYENRTDGFELSINKLPTGAQRYIEVTNSNQNQHVYRVAITDGSRYYLMTGYPCNLTNNVNCGICDAQHATCLACTNNYSLLDGICQQICPTNYLSNNWKCIAANSTTPPSTKRSNASKVIMWIFIGLAIGLIVTMAVLTLLWYLRQKSEQQFTRNQNMDGLQPSDRRILTMPSQSIAQQPVPVSQPQLASIPMLISQQNIQTHLNPSRRVPAVPIPYYA